jgi:protocatechuate 3,4-dioxygenase beta subunit
MRSTFRLITLLVILSVLIAPAGFPSVSAADTQPPVQPEPAVIELEPQNHTSDLIPARVLAADRPSAHNATFIIDYVPAGEKNIWDQTCVAFPEEAKIPFQDVANKMGALINSSVPIRIQACWTSLPDGKLASTGFTYYLLSGTYSPPALTNALQGSDTYPESQCILNNQPARDCDDMLISVSDSANFYYGTDGNPGNKFDFESAMMHEIMHGLGFDGSMSGAYGIGAWGAMTSKNCQESALYDLYTVDSSNTNLINTFVYPCHSPELGSLLTNGSVYFGGENAKAANNGSNVPLYTPSLWQAQLSYVHLAENFNGTPNALMTRSLDPGEAIHHPGPIGLGVLKDIGWPDPTYDISGQITLGDGSPLSNVRIVDGAGHTTITDSSGNYTLSNVVPGSYTLTAYLTSYSFSPADQAVTITTSNMTGVNFTATLLTISGQVMLSNGTPVAGVTMTLNPDGYSGSYSTTTDANGNYSLKLPSENYTLTPGPYNPNYTFSPSSLTMTISATSISRSNFIATPITPVVSGQMPLSNGVAISTAGDQSQPTIQVESEAEGSASLKHIPDSVSAQNETGVPAPDYHSGQGATFIIDYVPAGTKNALQDTCGTFPEAAKAPLQAAANKMKALINSRIPIRIEVCWSSLPNGVLERSNPTAVVGSGYYGSPYKTYRPVALENAIDGYDTYAADVCAKAGYPLTWCNDISIVVSDSADFYYGTDGTPGSKLDFESVVMHGIMHGLGFTGQMQVVDGLGSWGYSTPRCTYPLIYDKFTLDGNGQKITDTAIYPCNSAALANILSSGSVYFGGANAKAANGGSNVPLYVPNPWQPAASYSHLAESFDGTPNALMTNSLNPGEAIHDPGPIGLAVLKDIGWPEPTYTVSGRITRSDGSPLKDIAISCWPGYGGKTDLNGNYTIIGLPPRTYNISVITSTSGYTFSPDNQNVTVVANDLAGVNFTATPITYSITGQVKLSGGAGLDGVTINAKTGLSSTTNTNGEFGFSGVTPGTYAITPSKAGYTFSPAYKLITISSYDPGASFTANPITYSISGQIKMNGKGLAAVTIHDEAGHSAITDASGNYTIYGVAPGSYTLTASRSGYTFSPATQVVSVTSTNLTGLNFTPALITYAVSGQITLSDGGPAVGFSISTDTGYTTLTNASGDYTLMLPIGVHKLIPGKPKYTNSPISQTVTVASAPQTGVNFTVTFHPDWQVFFIPAIQR